MSNIDDIKELAEKLLEIQSQAKQLGIFIDDRDLIECNHCQLVEDVAFDGRLLTYWKTDPHYKDSGLRFSPLNQSETSFQCPYCGNQITLNNESDVIMDLR